MARSGLGIDQKVASALDDVALGGGNGLDGQHARSGLCFERSIRAVGFKRGSGGLGGALGASTTGEREA